ncbi:hypothetical protein TSAR_015727, partial [Trichomalopsis sarcophagae]
MDIDTEQQEKHQQSHGVSVKRGVDFQGPASSEPSVERVAVSQAPASSKSPVKRVTDSQPPVSLMSPAGTVVSPSPSSRRPSSSSLDPLNLPKKFSPTDEPLGEISLLRVSNILIPVTTMELFFQRFDMLQDQLDELKALVSRDSASRGVSPAPTEGAATVEAENLNTRVSALETQLIDNINASNKLFDVNKLLLDENSTLRDELRKTQQLLGDLHRGRRNPNSESGTGSDSQSASSGGLLTACSHVLGAGAVTEVAGVQASFSLHIAPISGVSLSDEGGSEGCEVIIRGLLKDSNKISKELSDGADLALLSTVLPSLSGGDIVVTRKNAMCDRCRALSTNRSLTPPAATAIATTTSATNSSRQSDKSTPPVTSTPAAATPATKPARQSNKSALRKPSPPAGIRQVSTRTGPKPVLQKATTTRHASPYQQQQRQQTRRIALTPRVKAETGDHDDGDSVLDSSLPSIADTEQQEKHQQSHGVSVKRVVDFQGPASSEPSVERVAVSQAPASSKSPVKWVTDSQAPVSSKSPAGTVVSPSPSLRRPSSSSLDPLNLPKKFPPTDAPLGEISLLGVSNILIPVTMMELFFQRFDMLQDQLDELKALVSRDSASLGVSPAPTEGAATVDAEDLNTRVSALETQLIDNINASNKLFDVNKLLLDENSALRDELRETQQLLGDLHRGRRNPNSESGTGPDSQSASGGGLLTACSRVLGAGAVTEVAGVQASSSPQIAPISGVSLSDGGGSEGCEVIIHGLLKDSNKISKELSNGATLALLSTVLPSLSGGDIVGTRVLRPRGPGRGRGGDVIATNSGAKRSTLPTLMARLARPGL